ncbi:MAG TPA: AMP-binding protein [Terriglobia bacterium]|nr:AMP-binding protein [Terriglobia bacterium]
MLNTLRKPFERVFIGESVPALVRWGRAVPPRLVRGMQDDAFRASVRYAAQHQRFFARQLKERGIDASSVRRPEDLGDIFTTADDLLSLPPEDFLCRPPESVFETTGTSGEPKRVYFGYDELDASARHEAGALYENGVRPGDRVVCTFDAAYWISSWVTFLACKRLGVFCSAIGKPAPRDFYSRLRLYGYNVIIADPTWLVSLGEIAEKEGAPPVKLILAAGDRMTDVYRDYVRDVFQAPVFLGYGFTEAGGGIGMECREHQGYHIDDYDFHFEILNPDAEGYGELVMTTLSRCTEPLIRYRVRDITRFIEEPCPCGVRLRRIARIRGRRDEMVVMGAGNMHPEIFERVLGGVEGVSERWQVAVRQEGLRDILEFRIELANGAGAEAVETAVRHNLETRYPDVWANQLCDMYRLAFRFLPPGTLGQGRKPKRLVDERSE